MKELNENQMQDIIDLSIKIVNELVSNELIKDCTDTDSMDELDAQEIVYSLIEKYILKNQLN
jgi:hypothetical protein